MTATFTLEPLGELLESWRRLLGAVWDVRLSGYNQVWPELWDRSSATRLNVGLNVLLIRPADFRRTGEGEPDRMRRGTKPEDGLAGEIGRGLAAAVAGSSARWLVIVTPQGEVPSAEELGVVAELRAVAVGHPMVRVDAGWEVAAAYAVGAVFDADGDRLGHLPHPPEYLGALAAVIARWARAASALPAKLVAVDADQTLWRGVVGEVGVAGVVVDPACRALQVVLRGLRERGMLIAIVSKNEPADVEAVLHSHPDMLLRAGDFVAVRAGWRAKSQVLRELSAELNLGMDSFVFLDDNPVEVAEVRAHAPSVVALQVPAEAGDDREAERTMRQFLQHIWAFDTAGTTTNEDAARTSLYQAHSERSEALREAPSFAAFLDCLELEVTVAPARTADFPRLAQLTQRTNQFNAIGHRRSEAEFTADVAAGLTALAVSVRDRFGDYGLVGLVGFRSRDTIVKVEHFLLSCRAMGRRVERRMVEVLLEEAARRQATDVQLPLVPSSRNAPVAAFLRDQFSDCDHGGVYHLPERVVCWRDTGSTAVAPLENQPVATADRMPAPAADLWQHIASDWSTGRGALAAATTIRPRPTVPGADHRDPRGDLECRVAARFGEVLKYWGIGADDSFFDLGGQSLQAAQVLARLSRDYGHRLPLRLLFDHPTPAALAAQLASVAPAAAGTVPLTPRDRPAYPLSAAQRRLWFLDRAAPGQRAYHIVSACHVHGALDINRLRWALERLNHRHEGLRARFPEVDGQPVQCFDGPGIEIVIHDEPAAEPAITTSSITPCGCAPVVDFDLATGPLARLDLTIRPEGEALAVFTLHHIIADGWSLGVLWRDLAALMVGRALDPLACQPLDLAAQQDRQRIGGNDDDLAYWRHALRDAPEALNLPVDFPRPSDCSFGGAVVAATLPEPLTMALTALGRHHGTTFFSVLMAGFHALLHRWSGQDDILVGTPVSGRSELSSEALVGCLINTVVIRSRPRPEQPLVCLLEEIRDACLDALAHQELPFDRLVDFLGVRRSRSMAPLFQVMLVLQNPPSALEIPGTTSSPSPIHNGTAKYDLVLEATPLPDGSTALALEFSTSRFRAESAAQMLSSFLSVLAHAASEPSTPLSCLRLLTTGERLRLLGDANSQRSLPPPKSTVHEWFERTADRFPHRPAISCGSSTLSYGTLNRRANQIAHHLRESGAAPGTFIALYLERGIDLVAGLLGILKSGAAYVPIDPGYPADRIAFMLKDADAPIVLSQRHLAEQLPARHAVIVCLDDPSSGLNDQPTSNPSPAAGANDLIYVIYTSGSTGQPKGCCVTHHNVARLFSATDHWFHFDEDDVWTQFHSHAFDFSVWEIWGALLHGGRLVVVPHGVSRSPEDFRALLVSERVTVLNQTPSAFRQLIAADKAEVGPGLEPMALRLVILGGEALEMPSLQPWFERHGDAHPQVVNMYGITETTVHVTYRPLSARDLTGGSVIGTPIPDLRLYILDPLLQPCPPGVAGELFIGGDGVAQGYLNRADLTSERFINSPFVAGDRLYRTGDLARRPPGRDVEYLGRVDRQLKIRGFRIEPGEIESTLRTHPSVADAAVLAWDGGRGQQLAAWIVPASVASGGANPAVSADTLRAHLSCSLPDHMVPSAWGVVSRLPLTLNGKLDPTALPPPSLERDLAARFDAPATPGEITLAAIWRKVLRVGHIGRHDNFFAIGGDSILSIQVISLARQAGWPLSPRHLFEHQTVAGLAAYADALVPHPASTSLVARACGSVPLTPIQRWFAALPLADPQWWNQAFLLELRRPAGAEMMRAALRVVLDRHDAFRLRCRFPCTGEARLATQWYDATAGDPVLEVLEGEGGLMNAMERAHRSLHMETGPVVAAVLTPTRLFLAAHHMVIDGVSWRIVLEDLESALDGNHPAAPGDSFQAWSRALQEASAAFAGEHSHWEKFLHPPALLFSPAAGWSGDDSEAGVTITAVEFSTIETACLLTELPVRTRARVDELLLAAVAMALREVTAQATVRIHAEGHGREELISGVDVTRTVGWFTAMYPVEISLPAGRDPTAALIAAKDQLRTVPNRGLGWGVLGLAEAASQPPEVVFNYFGQLDGLVAGSTWFRLTREQSPPWRGRSNQRPHSVEIEGFVRDGCLRVEFRFNQARHPEATRFALAEAFGSSLRQLLEIDRAPAASDFPGVRVTPAQLEALEPVDEVWPLSPMQRLLAEAAAIKGGAAHDQWHCRLRGPLDHAAFQRAWDLVAARHPLLRARLAPLDAEEMVVVIPILGHSPVATWRVEDWRERTPSDQAADLVQLRLDDRRLRTSHAATPLLRCTLIRLADDDHFFLWSVPDWMLDGWSWPIVFRELGDFYRDPVRVLPPSRSYHEYLSWLTRHEPTGDECYWRSELAGFTSPTRLPLDAPEAASGPRRETGLVIPSALWDSLTRSSRDRGIAPSALLMAAWAEVLAQATSDQDIVFGAATSGRPAELSGIEEIVGPCTTNLPIRVQTAAGQSLAATAGNVQKKLFGAISHQLVTPLQVQEWSAVPWCDRLFDSLVVFQNYEVGSAGRSLGNLIRIEDFSGPLHGGYVLTLVATPQADGLHLLLAYSSGRCSDARAMAIVSALARIVGAGLDSPPAVHPLGWMPPAPTTAARRARPAGQASTLPRTPLERAIHSVWERAFGTHIGMEENFFDVGGHSLLAIRVVAALRAELGRPLSAADVFQFPTNGSLARHLEKSTHPTARPNTFGMPPSAPDPAAINARAARARQALGQR